MHGEKNKKIIVLNARNKHLKKCAFIIIIIITIIITG